MKLVLFDIDGTLVREYAESASKLLIQKHFGMTVDPKAVHVSGMTDRKVLIERLKNGGIANPEKHPLFETALDDFATVTKEIIDRHGIEKVENAENLIKRLLKEKIVLGILTGNTMERAKIKLEAVGLWNYFKIGAFGRATTIRSELVEVAINEAKEKLGIEFKKSDVFIIGDTLRDIQCAKAGGVKSIAVATGKETLEALQKEKPDFAFKDLKNAKAITKAILG